MPRQPLRGSVTGGVCYSDLYAGRSRALHALTDLKSEMRRIQRNGTGIGPDFEGGGPGRGSANSAARSQTGRDENGQRSAGKICKANQSVHRGFASFADGMETSASTAKRIGDTGQSLAKM